ncbi:DUF5711 family protein [Oscillospiraceae bacterium OttesenSCG-928-G22]|nr:DUF5711 family protein [Oscillospiraceae bacterium OttesenSCG-928-G22]
MNEKRKGGPLSSILRGVALLLFCALVLFVVINRDSISLRKIVGFFTASEDRKTVDVLNFSADPMNFYYPYRGGLAVLSRGGLSVVGPEDEEELYIQKNMKRPLITGNGKSFLACDIGDATCIYVSDYEAAELDWPGAILSAEMNLQGYTAIVTDESGTKSTATVLSADRNEIYKWYSSERYLITASVSPKNTRLAVAGISERDARIVSSVCLFDLSERDMQASYECFDSLLIDLCYVDEDRIAVLSERELLLIDSEGERVSAYPFDGRAVSAFDFSGNGFLTVALADRGASGDTEVLTFDFDGKLLGRDTATRFLTLSVNGKSVAVLTSDTLLLYNSTMDPTSEFPAGPGVKRALLREDGSALLISSTKATLVAP